MNAAVEELDIPELDADGILRYRGRWVATSRQEERALRPFLTRWGRMVSPGVLAQAAWTRDAPPRAMTSLIHRLRRRVEPLGLTIHNIYARGFILEPASPDKGSAWPIS